MSDVPTFICYVWSSSGTPHKRILVDMLCFSLDFCAKFTVPSLPLPFCNRGLVEESLGQPVDTMFRSFEDRPLGAASIGQVHRVTMKDGRKAVVKVTAGEIVPVQSVV